MFHDDLGFSRRMMYFVQKILETTTFPKRIQNNEGTELDFKGHDLTLNPLQIGVRIRRGKYKKFDDFTEDFKEAREMEDDYYFFGYAYDDESGLSSYIIFDHNDFRKARDNDLLRHRKRNNEEHSGVPFFCYPLYDIFKNCNVIKKQGKIAYKKERSGYKNPVPQKNGTILTFDELWGRITGGAAE